MMLTKSALLEIKNKQSSICGIYFVKTTDVKAETTKIETYNYGNYVVPMLYLMFETCNMVRARYNESDNAYMFAASGEEQYSYVIPLQNIVYGITNRVTISKDIHIYFPGSTTYNILQTKGLIRLLSQDKTIATVIGCLLGSDYGIPGEVPGSMIEHYFEGIAMDGEIRLKLDAGWKMDFEDIVEARDVEIRERALSKFGYENFIKEGFKRKKIRTIILKDEVFIVPPFDISKCSAEEQIRYSEHIRNWKKEERIILFEEQDISFLEVKDSSTNKTYFLKIPPNIRNIQEAKAWTFGLTKEEYNPVIET